MINAGNLEEDTPQVEEEPPGPEVGAHYRDITSMYYSYITQVM